MSSRFLLTLLTSLIAIEICQAVDLIDVYTSGKEGYHTFRIPSLLVTKKGTLLAFCEGRKDNRRDHGDIDLIIKRSEDNGKTWSKLSIVYEEGGAKKVTIGNPCPVVDQSTGIIWMPFTRDNDDVLMTHSKDDGKSWSKPVNITADVKKKDWTWYATGPGVGIQLTQGRHQGRLLIPCDHRELLEGKQVTHSHCFYSDDHGKTWKLGETVAPYTNECQAVELSDGRVMINMRNYWSRTGKRPERGGKRAIAISKDGGHSWGKLSFDQTLIEPVCQASIERYSAKKILFSNPASTSKRHQLTVRLSTDSGQTWPKSRVIYAAPAAYSCLAVLPDQTICCLFERGTKSAYEQISLARFDLTWLQQKR